MVMEKSYCLIAKKSESSQEREQLSQHSQSSEEIDSSQEEMEQIDPWDRIQDNAKITTTPWFLSTEKSPGKCSWNTSNECMQ